MLARLWTRHEVGADTTPKPLPPTLAAHHCAEPTSPTVVPNQSRKRRQKRDRVCRLYARPEPQPLLHARALLAFIQEECPDYIGGYVPRPDMEMFYRRDLCDREGWEPFHWTAVARRLGEITHKKSKRDNGERFIAYLVPRP